MTPRKTDRGNLQFSLKGEYFMGGNVKLPLKSIDTIFIGDNHGSIENLTFPDVEYVKYAIFMKNIYTDNVYIDDVYRSIPIISMNLPYEYYSKFDVRSKVGTVDKNGNISFDLHKFVIQYYFGSVVDYGFIDPVFLQINHGNIVYSDTEGCIMLMIAQYLRLPSIPVSLYLADDEGASAEYDEENVSQANSMLFDRFITHVKGVNDDVMEKVNDGNYITFQNPEEDDVVDYYLMTGSTLLGRPIKLSGVTNISNITTDAGSIEQSVTRRARSILVEDAERAIEIIGE